MKHSHLICLSHILLSLSFLSHRCVAVRGSMAQHLNLLVDSFGAALILTAGKSFTERFLIAVSKMCVDAAPEVRWVTKFYNLSVQFYTSL